MLVAFALAAPASAQTTSCRSMVTRYAGIAFHDWRIRFGGGTDCHRARKVLRTFAHRRGPYAEDCHGLANSCRVGRFSCFIDYDQHDYFGGRCSAPSRSGFWKDIDFRERQRFLVDMGNPS